MPTRITKVDHGGSNFFLLSTDARRRKKEGREAVPGAISTWLILMTNVAEGRKG